VERADVLIVGGGPAGSACATRLVAAGRDVLVVDAREFPRDKPCAGWITPEVVAETGLHLVEYGRANTLQPISRFRVGRIGGRAVDVEYGAPVSYGIRRCEFDAFLLRRSGARVRAGEQVSEIRRTGEEWVLDGRLSAPILVGAGGHFCPVAREIAGPPLAASVVVAREIEYALDDEALARCRVDGRRPELDFCADLAGYGWCFRKGHYLNVGLGRRDPRRLGAHVEDYVSRLVAEGRIQAPPRAGWRGHAYHLRQGRRRLVADGALLVGDAAGLAYAASGEGILPALVSGRIAAETVLEAGPAPRAERLGTYVERLDDALGRPAGERSLPGPLLAMGGAVLLSSPWLVRRLVLDRWFLHRGAHARAGAGVAAVVE
jgi:geranylgeranyl reductase family protein